MRIGVLGGTFDPLHIGHLILGAEAHHQLGLDRLLWVLTPDPPHKIGRAIIPLAYRLKMLQAAIAGNPAFSLSRVEIDRPPPHFAVDTLRLLNAQFSEAALFYIMGGDSLHDLPDWHTPLEFLAECEGVGVMRRPGDRIDLTGLEARLPGITQKVRFIDAPLLEISASEIRTRIRQGRPYRYFLPPPVYRIIQELGLYVDYTQ